MIGEGGEAHVLRAAIACLGEIEADWYDPEGPSVFFEVPADLMRRIDEALSYLQTERRA